MRHLATMGVLAVVLGFGGSHTVRADPIYITGGFLEMQGSIGDLVLTGVPDFALSRRVGTVGGRIVPAQDCGITPCDPGGLSLHALWVGHDISGTVRYRGVEYEQVGTAASPHSLLVDFAGDAMLPGLRGELITLVNPFTFSGIFSLDGHPIPLLGLGTATLQMLGRVGDGPLPPGWYFQSVRYDFAPIPEPSTLLLVGGAALGARVLRRRRKANGGVGTGSN